LIYVYAGDIFKLETIPPYTRSLLFDSSAQPLTGIEYPSSTSNNMVVFEGDGNGGDESVYRLDTVNPNES
jgi:hypothetical protein